MANTPVFTIGAVSAASTQLSVCRCRSAFATSPAQSPHKTALPTHTTTSQNGLATHKRFVNSSVPVMPATRQTIPNIAPRPAPAPGPNKIAPTTMGTSVSEIGTGPMRIPLQDNDQRGQQGQRGQTDDGCVVTAFHKYLLLSLRILSDATQFYLTALHNYSAQLACICSPCFTKILGNP